MNPAGLRPAEIRDWAGETAGLGRVFARCVTESGTRRHALEDRGEPEQIERNVEIERSRRRFGRAAGALQVSRDVCMFRRNAERRRRRGGTTTLDLCLRWSGTIGLH